MRPVVDVFGGIVGVLVLVGAIGLFITRGPRHHRVRSSLWKVVGVAVLVLIIVGYLRAHDVRS